MTRIGNAGSGGPAARPSIEDNTAPDSWDLVRETQGGDGEAFGQLYTRYYRTIYSYVLRRTGHVALSEDLTSETFLRAFRKIGSVRFHGTPVRAWITTIARNVVIDHQRSAVRREIAVEAVDSVHAAASAHGPSGRHGTVESAEQVLFARQHGAELRACLRELTPAQRQCVVLRFYDDLSVSATAAAMRRNAASVRALQHRAVRRLAEVVTAPGRPVLAKGCR